MRKGVMKKILGMAVAAGLLYILGAKIGFTPHQTRVSLIFFTSIIGILLFWDFRLSIVFFSAGLMLVTHSIDLENLIRFASLDVILFLVGMMIMVGMLNDAGFFYWVITRLIRIKNVTGGKLFALLMVISGVLSGLIGEVASIIIMAKIIFDICELTDTDPVPIILASVMATNIGSSGTVLGNPIGILIAARANLTFEDFMARAFPITAAMFLVTLIILMVWYRKTIRGMTERLIPLRENSILMITPIVFAGIALLYRRDRIRYYIEKEVEWMSVLFFLFLFALSGAVKYSGVSDVMASGLINAVGGVSAYLTGVMLYSSGILSSVLDNTVVVASYIPIVQSLASAKVDIAPLWWAVLFGACYGGNITIIGSTANIVAADMLEKRHRSKIGFMAWLKIGLLVGIVTLTGSYIALLLLPH
jgi:Na+/H+ antiporter NhaD/arsenite permease-like protein